MKELSRTSLVRKARFLARESSLEDSEFIDKIFRHIAGFLEKRSGYHGHIELSGSLVRETAVGPESDCDILVVANPKGVVDSFPARQEFEEFKEKLESALTDFRPKLIVREAGKGFQVFKHSRGQGVDVIPAFAVDDIQFDWCVNSNKVDKVRKTIALAREFDGTPLVIQNRMNEWLLTIPSIHSDRMLLKDYHTNGRYLEVVRILKRLRNCLKVRGRAGGFVSSYAIEGLAWNVSTEAYLKADLVESLIQVEREIALFLTKKISGWTEIAGVGDPVGNYDPFQVLDVPPLCDFLASTFQFEPTIVDCNIAKVWDPSGWQGSASW